MAGIPSMIYPLNLNCEAYVLMLKGDKEGAEAKYRECLDLEPNSAQLNLKRKSPRFHESLFSIAELNLS
jgi:hypothetical protein